MPQVWPERTNLETRLWDSYHAKSSNIRHRQDCTQNKGQTELAGCRPSPSGDRQPELEGGNHGPREALSIKLKAGFIAN